MLQLVTTPMHIKHIPAYKDKHRYAIVALPARAHEGPLHNLAHNPPPLYKITDKTLETCPSEASACVG
jgi:hypothetical protein